MTIYRYSESPVVNEIIIRKTAGGGMRAFLFARDGIDSTKIEQTKELLNKKEWLCVANDYGGRPCLEVREAKDIETLESTLRTVGFLAGGKTVTKTKVEQKITWKDYFNNNKLTIYGILNHIADIGIFGYGRILGKLPPKPGETRNEHLEEKYAGYLYSGGSFFFTLFGRGDKSDHHLREIALKLRTQMQAMGLSTPESSSPGISPTNVSHSVFSDLWRFLTRHPSEIGNTIFGTAGALMLKAGLKSKNPQDAILGFSTLAGGYTAAFVKERATISAADAGVKQGGFWRFIEERPNRIAAIGYLVGTLVHTGEALRNLLRVKKDYTESQNDSKYYAHPRKMAYWAYGMRLWFGGVLLIAEAILAFASKGHGEGVKTDRGVDETAIALVADTIIRQPESMREQLIRELGFFLAKPDILSGDAADIEKSLRERISSLEKNPWSAGAAKTNMLPEIESPATQPAVQVTAWQEKELRRIPAQATMATAIS
jgi:hypothetical protein